MLYVNNMYSLVLPWRFLFHVVGGGCDTRKSDKSHANHCARTIPPDIQLTRPKGSMKPYHYVKDDETMNNSNAALESGQ